MTQVDVLSPSVDRSLSDQAPRIGDLLQLGFVAPLCFAAHDVGQALAYACRFSPLWCEREFVYDGSGPQVIVHARRDGAQDTRDRVNEVLLFCRLAEYVSARRIVPASIHAPAASRAVLRRALDCPIHDSEPRLALHFAREDAQRTNPAADPGLLRLLLTHAEQRLASVTGSEQLVERARRTLSRLAEQGDLRAELLARELGLGVRTLHRRLRAESTSYRKLLVEFQLERCRSELERASRSAKEIAFALGFADPASFHRAFKRWTGGTVAQYRRATYGCTELDDAPAEQP